jgi:hypothetical protein
VTVALNDAASTRFLPFMFPAHDAPFLMDDTSMDSMPDPKLAETQKVLQEIRDLPATLLKTAFDLQIPTDRAPPATFWAPYNEDERNIGLRACLMVWTVTYPKLVPREFQLEATIAIVSGRDSLIDVGTGYGKTLCMIIPCLLDPGLQEAITMFEYLRK